MGYITLEEQLHTTLHTAQALMQRAESVLFVTSQLRPRELKMADGLRKLGWTVGLIYCKWTPFDPAAFFDFAIEVASAEAAHVTAQQIAPRVAHVFSGAIDDFVMLFCRNKPSPVVIDLNDVFVPSLFDYCHERFEPTREALALADGFCARDLQVKSAQKVDGFKLPKQLVLFPEYCWKTATFEGGEKFPADEIHVVSVGTFSLETQGMFDSCYLQLARLLIGHQIHFHIYPHWAYRRDHLGSPHANFEKDFADFLALEKTSPYLHLHDSLPIEELAGVLPKFDFGIVSGGCEALGQKLRFYHRTYIETCYSGRISDYLEAGLPVLVNDEVAFDFWLLKRHRVCVDLKGVLQPGFKQSLLVLKQDAGQREVMERAVHKLSVASNAPRLAQFYMEVVASSSAVTVPCIPAMNANPTVPIGAEPIQSGGLSALLVRKIKWASPRLAKILLPYRASRIFQVRLHNALLEIQSNQVALADLRQEKAVSSVRIEDLQENVAGLSQKIAALDEDKTVLEQGNAALSSKISILSQKIAALNEDKTALEQGNAALASKIAILNQKIAALDEDKTVLEQGNAALSSNIAILHQKIAARDEDKTALEQGNAALSSKIASLNQKIAALDEDKAVLEQGNAALAGNIAILNQKVAALDEDKTVLEQSNAALSSKFEREKSDLTIQVADLLHDQAISRIQLAGLEQDKIALQQANEVSANKLTTLDRDNSALHVEQQQLLQDLSMSRERVKTLEMDSAGLTQAMDMLGREKSMLQQEVQWGKASIKEVAEALNWQEVLDDIERTNGFNEFVRILGLFSGSKNIGDAASACWNALATKNYDQLLNFGYFNFKRTIGNNYFNFLVQEGDPQIQAVEKLLSADVLDRARAIALSIPDDPDSASADQVSYRYFVLLLWEYVKAIDAKGFSRLIEEPLEGNPILVPREGRNLSQDLANSLIEYIAIDDAVSFENISSVLEIGGGYGRNAYVVLSLNPDVQVTLVDIPPALYLAERYLSSVFRGRRVFKVRNFSTYEEVMDEMAGASIVFLMPHQLTLMPPGKFDLGMNISSLHEMSSGQIAWYFEQLNRLTAKYFYHKQWRSSKNIFDGIVVNQDDYPYPEHWQEIYSRPCRVQNEFFEALYQVDNK